MSADIETALEEIAMTDRRLRTAAELDAQEARISEIEFREWRKRGRPLGTFDGWRDNGRRSSLKAALAA